ncbi:MAG: aspartate dehydrogenase [Eubacterium sp.]|nr:aspartate dehydrogenase [Eubacterium sp.]
MFKKKKTLSYDKDKLKPAIKASICTGEQTAGFIDVATGKFKDDMLIRGANDLYIFKEKYGITEEIDKIY